VTAVERDIVQVDNEPRMDFPEERISGVLLPSTRHASATIAIVKPGTSQTLHVHTRPNGGDEIIFVYRGSFAVRGDGWSGQIFDTGADGPVYLRVPSGVPVAIENKGQTQVCFYTVFVPPFEMGEMQYLE
jgi:mannose-6-phosphate isomerase-like protein (cupin superfamily)